MPPAEQLADSGLVPSQKTKRLPGPVWGGEIAFKEVDRTLGLVIVVDEALDELRTVTPR
jgi:hypothetical protein